MGSITSYCVKVIKDNFKLLTWLQIFIIAIAPNFIFYQVANATTVAGEGWSVTKTLVKGATTFYDGTKNVMINGKNVLATSAAAITPNASQVAKMIVRTGGVAAVSVAIQELLGAVDYVLDPENNRVKYFVTPETNPKFLYGPSFDFATSSPYGSCQKMEAANGNGSSWIGHISYDASRGSYGYCVGENFQNGWQINQYPNPAYDPANKEEKSIPYESVASQIINDAESENADAKTYVSSVADTALDSDENRQLVPASAVTQQLNGAQALPTTETAQGTSTPKTDDPAAPKAPPTDIKLNFPVFCSWAPTVCQAAQAGINYVASYTKDVDALKKEYADNPKFNDKPLEFDKDPATPDTTISFDGSCPTPLSAPYSFMGLSGSIEIPFTPLCKIAEISRPVIIAVSAYFAALIVGGIRSGDA